jgi:hypothetical protein
MLLVLKKPRSSYNLVIVTLQTQSDIGDKVISTIEYREPDLQTTISIRISRPTDEITSVWNSKFVQGLAMKTEKYVGSTILIWGYRDIVHHFQFVFYTHIKPRSEPYIIELRLLECCGHPDPKIRVPAISSSFQYWTNWTRL